MKKYLKDSVLWGFLLWLFGYILGMIFFPFVPNQFLGWVIFPFAAAFTIWVLYKKIKATSIKDYIITGAIWTVLAIVFDYIFIVKLLKPADGYYKFDVYLYYASCFLFPMIVGRYKLKKPLQTA